MFSLAALSDGVDCVQVFSSSRRSVSLNVFAILHVWSCTGVQFQLYVSVSDGVAIVQVLSC